MGVRFECPNGHKLHVKADLAGRRGICPACGAKFIVPSFSGGVATDAASVAVEPADSAGSSRTPSPASSPAAIDSPAATTPTPPLADDAEWYVRPPSGEQFGPAPTKLFRQWVAEGRVAADCWVWRTGWTDWKAGSDALALLANHAPPAAKPGAASKRVAATKPSAAATPDFEDFTPIADAEQNELDHLGTDDPFGTTEVDLDEANAAESRRAELRRRRRRTQSLSIVLVALALGAFIVLLVALSR